jgi:hypothetical protein
VRALKILVVAMGVLIIAGTVTLVALIVQRAGGFSSGGARLGLGLEQPAGTRISGIAGLDQALAIWVQRPDGTESVLLVDPRRGRTLGEITPGAAGVPPR